MTINRSISMKRFKHIGSVGGTKYVELPNGFGHRQFVKMFDFVFAYLNASISSQITTAGTNSTSSRVIASMDPRFEPYMKATNGCQIAIDGTNYKIASVSKDDTPAIPIYTVTIKLKDGY